MPSLYMLLLLRVLAKPKKNKQTKRSEREAYGGLEGFWEEVGHAAADDEEEPARTKKPTYGGCCWCCTWKKTIRFPSLAPQARSGAVVSAAHIFDQKIKRSISCPPQYQQIKS